MPDLSAIDHDDGLELTTYFSELRRTQDRFLSDELVDLYAREGVKLSLIQRGAASFGRSHVADDGQLTLSENLPLVSVAVDTRERIDAVLDDVIALTPDGLVTLAPTRLLSRETAAVAAPSQTGTSARLTIYLDRAARVGGSPAFVAACDLLHRAGVICATVLAAATGTADGVGRARGANGVAWITIVAVGASKVVHSLLPELAATLQGSLLTLEEVQICKRDGDLIAPPGWVSAIDRRGGEVAQKLVIYAPSRARHKRTPMHAALIRALRAAGASGATQLRGVWGFDGDEAPHGDHLLPLPRDVPMVTLAVDSPEQTWRSFQIVDELTGDGVLVTCETVIIPARWAR